MNRTLYGSSQLSRCTSFKIRNKVSLILALLLTSITTNQFVLADSSSSFYLISADDNGLYRVSTDMGQPDLIGFVDVGTDLYELVDVGEYLLTIDRTMDLLLTISKIDASVVSNVQIDSNVFVTRRGIDIDSNGVVYGLFEGLELRTLDVKTGATSVIATITGAARVEAIAFGPDGTLYACGTADNDSDSENVYTLDIATGELSLLGPTGFVDMDGLSFADDGFLYGVDANAGQSSNLFRISPIDGSAVDLGTTNVEAANGIAGISVGFLLGDTNSDGEVNLLDIAPFVNVLATGTFTPEADINQDGSVDLLDVGPFVELLNCN